MVYRGRVKNGVVVFEGNVTPPEGAIVNIEQVVTSKTDRGAQQLRDTLLKFAGSIDGAPADASVNLDHYLYGHPKVRE